MLDGAAPPVVDAVFDPEELLPPPQPATRTASAAVSSAPRIGQYFRTLDANVRSQTVRTVRTMSAAHAAAANGTRPYSVVRCSSARPSERVISTSARSSRCCPWEAPAAREMFSFI